MRALSSVGIGLSLISGCLFLALVAEVYYLLWWKKKRTAIDAEENYLSPAKEFLDLFCWKKAPFLSSAAVNPQAISAAASGAARAGDVHLHLQPDSSSKDFLLNQPFGDHQDTAEAELIRLHSLAGPPRLLFTIKEETKEDMESESGRSRKEGSRGKSLSDFFLSPDSPFLTPISSPPLPVRPPVAPLECAGRNGMNSRDEDLSRMWTSPPPQLKFLRDAEEKLYRKILMDEALKVQMNGARSSKEVMNKEAPSSAPCPEQGDGSFITIVIGKSRERGHQHHSSASQVIPLVSSPLSTTTPHEKTSSKE